MKVNKIEFGQPKTCHAEVPGYGTCGRKESHVVHQMLGISEVEHLFKRETTGEVEKMRLSKRNIKKIARRSGKTEDELEMMRQVAKKQGRVLTLQYEVVVP